MPEENKHNNPNKKDDNKKGFEPEFLWTDVYRLGANSCEILPAAKTQNRVLNELLPRRKKSYSLPEWFMEQKMQDNEDLLYSLCGVVHPAEGEMLFHYVHRWQKDLINEKQKGFSFDEDDEGARIISVPKATIQNFLADPHRVEFMLENHENLLLRLGAVKKTLTQLADALYIEGVHHDKGAWESAMDELVGQYEFPDKASLPQDEKTCWLWMSKMTAPIKNNLWHLNLNTTQSAVEKFNWFRIHKSFADLLDFADHPVCTQRINGKLEKTLVPWMAAKILMTAQFLVKNGFLDSDALQEAMNMSKEERVTYESNLKRYVVSAFAVDLCKSAPDNETLHSMWRGFTNYFTPILRQTGVPVLNEILAAQKNKKGDVTWNGIINVAFYPKNTKVVQTKTEQKAEVSQRVKPNRPDSDLSR